MKFLQKIGAGFARFMYGRNGMDHLNLALVWMCLIASLLSSLLRIGILYYFSMALWCIAIFRMFSKNVYKRQEENSKWCSFWFGMKSSLRGAKERRQDKDHKYFVCKNCKTICRVPRGKGKIEITCPKCGAKIHGKS
ncbi:hypothetical protein KQI82_15135 [Oscillibacter sp. MSJ-2]|uniref:Zn-finger containing protein n=1 Tax=Dysosmobacter acutus TaxID=2841504 RepID=A0ABS6FD74_9FIRM|nr:hypothetical protein [Dysosmobacter acutus]MBU5628244.1 hypothetical protein [Dysosmobacter acutus]